MRARPVAIVVVLLTFAWVALPFLAADDTAPGHDFHDDASLLQRSEAAAAVVVGDRATKARSVGFPIVYGALAVVALALMALRFGVAGVVGVTVLRPSTRRACLERGPPAF